MSGSCGWFPLSPAEIDAWVERHRNDLPTTLEALSRLPIPFRKAIVNVISGVQRVALWQEHLSTFLEPDGSLTADQRALVQDAIAQLPAMFAAPDQERRQSVRLLEDRMRTLITREQAYRMFGVLGPPEPPEGLPLPPDAVPTARS